MIMEQVKNRPFADHVNISPTIFHLKPTLVTIIVYTHYFS